MQQREINYYYYLKTVSAQMKYGINFIHVQKLNKHPFIESQGKISSKHILILSEISFDTLIENLTLINIISSIHNATSNFH